MTSRTTYPILLKAFLIHHQCKKNTLNRFENYWVMDEGCESIMRLAPDEPVQCYVTNIKHRMYELPDWNRDRINLRQDKLKIVSDMTIRKSIFLGNLSFVRSVNSDRRKSLLVAKVSDFLRFGDCNSSWLHTKANMRRTGGPDGKLYTKQGDLAFLECTHWNITRSSSSKPTSRTLSASSNTRNYHLKKTAVRHRQSALSRT
ncbi:LOW QUALITY PROTEIN: hypothetical protein Cgig2_012705 [Carnegiea gigantea]|uniref:Uncharacterized protein n=1 Tax=Carnegiea gigantea TaxID=171969 RepID=A0A9Q1JQ67_9CARY|nr:LOW QUALITY PROTEIN: hypothetical protein Cgig2_012705 [Carnegiea gigantea]